MARAASLEQILAEKMTAARVTGGYIQCDADCLQAMGDLVHRALKALDECDKARADLAATVRTIADRESRWGMFAGMQLILGMPLVLMFWNWCMYRLWPANYHVEGEKKCWEIFGTGRQTP